MSDFDVLGTVGKLALPSFSRFWVRGKPSLGWRNMVPRTEATGVFLVCWRAFFRRRFRLDRGKSWWSESSTLCLNMSSFQRIQTRGSTRCESGRLCAQAWHRRRGKLWNFQHSLISSVCFRAHGRRSSRCRISAILVSSESLHYLLSKSMGLVQRRTWVREIWSCEQRPLECSSYRGVIFWSKFRLDRSSSWRFGSCTS
jgi:hypothetical protein